MVAWTFGFRNEQDMEIQSNAAQTLASSAQTPSVRESSVISSDFETFLQMLTAQARYQDPLEPLDSTEYASQLATFSSVEQQVKTNDLLTAMATQLGAGNMAQFAGWIGMEARTTAPTYFDGSSITISPNPAAVAQNVQLVAIDSSGAEVQRIDLPVSADPYEWTGTAEDGSALSNGLYSFKVESFANGNLVLSEAAEVYSRITETRSEGGETLLILEGGAPVVATSITALREPEAS